MSNIFNREKPEENKDPQPEQDLNPAAPETEETSAALNVAETSREEIPEPPINDTSSPEAANAHNHSEAGTGYIPASAEESAKKNNVPDIGTVQEPPAPRKGLAYRLFSPETRLGGVMRPVLRWLAAIIGLFALGLLAGYILNYQPAQRELDAALARLATTSQIVDQKQLGLETAQTGLGQAQLSLKQAQEKLDAAASENKLLIVMVDVSDARVALAAKDGAAAKNAIEQAQTNLSQALPYIESQDKVLSDLLKSRLDLIGKELVSDSQAAQSDLGKLASDLDSLHQKIFK